LVGTLIDIQYYRPRSELMAPLWGPTRTEGLPLRGGHDAKRPTNWGPPPGATGGHQGTRATRAYQPGRGADGRPLLPVAWGKKSRQTGRMSHVARKAQRGTVLVDTDGTGEDPPPQVNGKRASTAREMSFKGMMFKKDPRKFTNGMEDEYSDGMDDDEDLPESPTKMRRKAQGKTEEGDDSDDSTGKKTPQYVPAASSQASPRSQSKPPQEVGLAIRPIPTPTNLSNCWRST
jgi:hypothetical protein